MTRTKWKRPFAVLFAVLMITSMFVGSLSFLGTETAAAAPGDPGDPSFDKSTLQGFSASNPTAIDFGPGGRVYVSTQGGAVYALDVERTGDNSYQVVNEVKIGVINNIPNHDDDGNYVPGETNRQITGLTVGGTADQPVVYVSSSDPSIDVGQDDDDTDTNSGAISRLTISPGSDGTLQTSEVDHDVLVMGLPRSEENHATNGLSLSADGDTLYVAQGGNTNMGAPSNNFGNTPEYALSGAILEIDLAQINNYEAKNLQNYEPQGSDESYPNLDFYYGIPTIQNDDATDGDDLPFGGNDGINQAKLVEGGPVQIYSAGYRNPYDLVVTESGQIYASDHGPNGGWGGQPVDASGNIVTDASSVTNHPSEEGSFSTKDQLVKVDEGDYGGHPAPIRANPTGADIYNADGDQTFNITEENSPVPSSMVNPAEADYIPATSQSPDPGAPAGSANTMVEENGGAVLFDPTGAIDEYTASNFGGAMQGDLLQAELDGDIKRIELSADGSTVTNVGTIFNTDGPLGLTTVGDDGPFPGTVWTADRGPGTVTIFEPTDYGGGDGQQCTGADDPSLDEDGDGYDNADELDAGSDPCSSASTPADFDDDGTSNQNDSDDDNDGQPDTSDPFALDPNDGTTTTLPVEYDLSELSVFDQGWTGLMTNGEADYQSLYNTSNMTVGGAAEVLTVEEVPQGDAYWNTQQYGFQFGVNAPAEPFTVETTVNGLPESPEDHQSLGVFIGDGDQDNYLKLVASANDGTGGVQFAKETNGEFEEITFPDDPAVTGPANDTDLSMTVYPGNNTVVAYYTAMDGEKTKVGQTTIPASWLDSSDGTGLAVGTIATSSGASSTFSATWNDISVTPFEANGGDGTSNAAPTADAGADQTVDENATVTLDAGASSDPDGDALSYNWTQVAGPDVQLSGQQSQSPTLTAPAVDSSTTLTFKVTASDGQTSATDTVNVTVQDTNSSTGGDAPANGTIVHRVNTGGSEVAATGDGPDWSADTESSPSQYLQAGGMVSNYQPYTVDNIDASVPAGTPTEVFQTERWDPSESPEMQWSFPAQSGSTYEVRLYFHDGYSGTSQVGDRVFGVNAEGGEAELQSFDPIEAYGDDTAGMESFQVTPSDDSIDLTFLHETENPQITAIEIVKVSDGSGSGGSNAAPTIDAIANQTVTEGDSATVPVSASDADGDTVSLSVNGPGFVSLSNDELTIAPQSGDAGTYTVDVTADDGTTTTTETFQLTVEQASSGGSGSSGETVFAVNAGGSQYTAADGTVYQADTNYDGGSTYTTSTAIEGTTNDALYQSERFGGSFGYDVPVENGEYEVTLQFAEIYHDSAGQRVFDASIEGQQVLNDYDIYAQAGGSSTPVSENFTVNVTDGALNVDFSTVTDNAKVSAIEATEVNGSGSSNGSDSGSAGSADIAVTDGSGIDSSTYDSDSFQIENTGEKKIESVTFDVNESLVPDAVFDPDGTAGDEVAKQLSIDSQSGDGVGVVSTADADVFSQPHNGQDNAEGYDVMSLGFDDFEPGESVGFSIDLDPTTIKGTSGSGGAGSVSGLEIIASSVTVEYADGTTQTTDLTSDGSNGGAQATADADVPAAPTLGVQGVSTLQDTQFPGHDAATVSGTSQTLTVSGPAGATVELVHVVGSEGPSDGYDLDPLEADNAESVGTQTVTLNSNGEATVDVNLSDSDLDYYVAYVVGDDGDAGRTSDVVILEEQ